MSPSLSAEGRQFDLPLTTGPAWGCSEIVDRRYRSTGTLTQQSLGGCLCPCMPVAYRKMLHADRTKNTLVWDLGRLLS